MRLYISRKKVIYLRLVTIQPLKVLEILKKTGRFFCSYAETVGTGDDFNNTFSDAYAWYIDQMILRVGAAPKGVYYPVWAWYKNEDECLFDGSWGEAGEIYARIEFEADDDRVLLSDFDAWHCALNNCPCCEGGTSEEYNKSFDAIMAAGKEAIRESWEKIFDVSNSACIQATIWGLCSKDIIAVETFVSKGSNLDNGDEELDA